jgi:hypothetical protein
MPKMWLVVPMGHEWSGCRLGGNLQTSGLEASRGVLQRKDEDGGCGMVGDMPIARSSISEFSVATANTHWGTMLHSESALDPLVSADIVMLQEVIDPERDVDKERLCAAGFEVVHVVGKFGLAILRRRESDVEVVPGSLAERRLLKMDRVEYRLMQRWAQRAHGFTEHGLIAVKFTTRAGQILTVVNVHPSMPIKPIARARQVFILRSLLGDSYYSGAMVLGGDMNHYPRPGLVDEIMRSSAGLARVDLGKQPTWYVQGTNQEKYIRMLASVWRRPISEFDAQLDTVLYRGDGLELVDARVVEVESDHRAIVTKFSLVTTEEDRVHGLCR